MATGIQIIVSAEGRAHEQEFQSPLLDSVGVGYAVSQARLTSLKGKGLLECMYKLCPIGIQKLP